MKTLSRRHFLASLAPLVAAPSFAVAAGWIKLGDRFVSLARDRDVIPVSFLKGRFRRIKLRVRRNSIFLTNVTVIYATGAPDVLPAIGLIKAGGETRALDLRGGERIIRSIHLTYRRVPNFKGMAEVVVYGR